VLLVDDLLASPVKGILWVFHEIHKAATEEQAARRDNIMAALSALYVSLEQHEISDQDFDTRERALLDELDAYDARAEADGEDQDEEVDGPDEDAEIDDDEDDDLDIHSVLPAVAPVGDPPQAAVALRADTAVMGPGPHGKRLS
jgi:hypothetical protein